MKAACYKSGMLVVGARDCTLVRNQLNADDTKHFHYNKTLIY